MGDLPVLAISRMTLEEKSLEIAANCFDATFVALPRSHIFKSPDIVDYTQFVLPIQAEKPLCRSSVC
jgi:hypothetical protein